MALNLCDGFSQYQSQPNSANVITDVLVEMVRSEPVEAVEAKVKEDHAITLLLPSTPKTQMLSQAWEHKFRIGI